MINAQYDVLIRNACIFDGAANPWFLADIGIRDGVIADIGRLGNPEAKRKIDARGKWVTPGFIDVHAHSDFALTILPDARSQVGQGITTEVIGNCGYSAYPRTESTRRLMFDPAGVDGEWSSPTEYFVALGSNSLRNNVVSLVGHGTIRYAVLAEQNRAVTDTELEAMCALTREAMTAGAAGLSTGLDYDPGVFASTDELVALCRVVAEFGGVYASHLRGYTDTLLDAVAEAISIGRQSGCAVHLSHMDVFGRANWGNGQRVVDMVNAAREEGIDVTADMMSYPTAGSWWAPRAIFPADVYDWKSSARDAQKAIRQLLLDPDARAELRRRVEERRLSNKKGFDEELMMFSDWHDITLQGVGPDSIAERWVGADMETIAAEMGMQPVDAYFDLLVQEGEHLSTVRISVDLEEFRLFAVQPWMMFGTDSIATSVEHSYEPFNTIMAHPRHYANFVRILTSHVRDLGWLTLPEAIRKMTSLPARRFGVRQRGLVAVGFAADLVIIDPETLQEQATWLDPRQYPTGIEHVLVNGTQTLSGGAFTSDLGGIPLLMRTGETA